MESNSSSARVVLLSRADCCLCDEALAAIEQARSEFPFTFEIRDVDEDPALAALYGEEVPVVLVDGRKAFKYRVEPRRLVRTLRGRRWFGLRGA